MGRLVLSSVVETSDPPLSRRRCVNPDTPYSEGLLGDYLENHENTDYNYHLPVQVVSVGSFRCHWVSSRESPEIVKWSFPLIYSPHDQFPLDIFHLLLLLDNTEVLDVVVVVVLSDVKTVIGKRNFKGSFVLRS